MSDHGLLSFDAHQWAGKRSRPVHATYTPDGWQSNGISFDDYERMQSSTHIGNHPRVPPWSLSDEKTRRVIAERIARSANSKLPLGTDLQSVRETEGPLVEVWKKSALSCPEMAVRLKAIARAGTLAGFYARIIYMSYRQGQDSPSVAVAMGMKPPAIRQILARLNIAARRLFPDDCLPPLPQEWKDKIAAGTRRFRPATKRAINEGLAVKMRQEGRSYGRIAHCFGVTTLTVVQALAAYEERRKAKCKRLGVAYTPRLSETVNV